MSAEAEAQGCHRSQVIFAGTPDQCRQVVESAESFREALVERGVLLVVLPIYGASGDGSAADIPPLKEDDLRCISSVACSDSSLYCTSCFLCGGR